MKSNLFGLHSTFALTPDGADGANIVVEQIKTGDNVEWIDRESDDEMFGAVKSIENGIATIIDDESKEHKVPVDDLNLAGEFKVIAELPLDKENPNSIKIQYTEKKYKKSRKASEAVLQGYGFAAPRYRSVDELRMHLTTVLKKQNRIKTEANPNGVTADDIILDNYHSMVDGKLRTRVKNEALEGVKQKGAAWFEGRDKILFNAEAAHSWAPGIREASGITKIKALAAKVKELQASGATVQNSPELLQALMELAGAAA